MALLMAMGMHLKKKWRRKMIKVTDVLAIFGGAALFLALFIGALYTGDVEASSFRNPAEFELTRNGG